MLCMFSVITFLLSSDLIISHTLFFHFIKIIKYFCVLSHTHTHTLCASVDLFPILHSLSPIYILCLMKQTCFWAVLIACVPYSNLKGQKFPHDKSDGELFFLFQLLKAMSWIWEMLKWRFSYFFNVHERRKTCNVFFIFCFDKNAQCFYYAHHKIHFFLLLLRSFFFLHLTLLLLLQLCFVALFMKGRLWRDIELFYRMKMGVDVETLFSVSHWIF